MDHIFFLSFPAVGGIDGTKTGSLNLVLNLGAMYLIWSGSGLWYLTWWCFTWWWWSTMKLNWPVESEVGTVMTVVVSSQLMIVHWALATICLRIPGTVVSSGQYHMLYPHCSHPVLVYLLLWLRYHVSVVGVDVLRHWTGTPAGDDHVPGKLWRRSEQQCKRWDCWVWLD